MLPTSSSPITTAASQFQVTGGSSRAESTGAGRLVARFEGAGCRTTLDGPGVVLRLVAGVLCAPPAVAAEAAGFAPPDTLSSETCAEGAGAASKLAGGGLTAGTGA
jgi:hypothetical protein